MSDYNIKHTVLLILALGGREALNGPVSKLPAHIHKAHNTLLEDLNNPGNREALIEYVEKMILQLQDLVAVLKFWEQEK